MSDDDPGIEHVQEDIHHHAHGAAERWIGAAALTAALLAALAAIGGSMAGHYLTESSRDQIHANDQWSYYQSKSIKQKMLESKMETLTALGKEVSEADKKKLSKYETDIEEIKQKAESLEKTSESHLHRHEVLERGVTMFHIGIAIVAISVLTKRKAAWFASMALGGVGIVYFVMGILHGH